MRIIYDIGANNGDDVPYYLKKCDLVVAVEPNPALVEEMSRRFSSEISNKRLFIEPSVITAEKESALVKFYLHTSHHVLSQFTRPLNIGKFREVVLPSLSVRELFSKYGEAHYVKIDVEGYDQMLLKAIFDIGIRPPYISAESHHPDVLYLLARHGGYRSFSLVDGASVDVRYKDHVIKTSVGSEIYSFPYHSAGPFGEDIVGDWYDYADFFRYLGFEGLGWKDIHATTEFEPTAVFDANKWIGTRMKSKIIEKLGLF